MDLKQKAMDYHYDWKGKLEIKSRVSVASKEDLTIAYSPGVAEPCLAIQKNPDLSYDLTRRWNTVAVITDGTAVLGLGDIGPEAGMPVMEGKCVLFKEFGGVDAVPLCIRSKNVDEIVNTISLLAGSFGGINLEDISSPRCIEIEARLKEICDIPIFHDDQHGTAIVTLAALINALKIVNKGKENIKIVMSGAGAAGSAIAKLLVKDGYKNIVVCGSKGAISKDEYYNREEYKKISEYTNPNNENGLLRDVIKNADVFIGVSAPNIVDKDMVRSMATDPIVFATANPTPEIMPEDAKEAGARVVGTGRSDYPNQINNVLAFPGIFRGALDVRARDINDEMKIAAAYALADLVDNYELSEDYIIVPPFDNRVADAVSKKVKQVAIDTGVARKR